MHDRERQGAWLAGIVGTLAGGASAGTAIRNADQVQKAFEDRWPVEGIDLTPPEPFAKGKQSYSHIKYADSPTGEGMRDEWNGAGFIGTCTSFYEESPVDPSFYRWQEMTRG